MILAGFWLYSPCHLTLFQKANAEALILQLLSLFAGQDILTKQQIEILSLRRN
jgi:hypothetical protein